MYSLFKEAIFCIVRERNSFFSITYFLETLVMSILYLEWYKFDNFIFSLAFLWFMFFIGLHLNTTKSSRWHPNRIANKLIKGTLLQRIWGKMVNSYSHKEWNNGKRIHSEKECSFVDFDVIGILSYTDLVVFSP